MPFNKLISIPLNQHFLRKVRRAISLVRAKNIGSVRLNIQPECIQTIIMAWGFRRYPYGTGKTRVRYGNCISFLQFPPRSQGSADAKEEELWIVMAVCLTRYLFQSWDFLQVVPVLEDLDLWIETLENGLLRHQANAVREVLDFDAILSGPICFFPLNESLCNRDPLPRFVCKQRAALPGILLNFGMKKYETSIGSTENSQTLPTQDEKKDETCTNEYAWIWSFG